MVDLAKLVQGRHLTETEEKVLYYIVKHIDEVLNMGVRQIAKANYTSTSTIMRLTKKMGYTGFVDMHYRLLPLVKRSDEVHQSDMQFIDRSSINTLLQYNTYEVIQEFSRELSLLNRKYIFIYATGFSAITAEYLYKKLLVLGKKCILASGVDSIGVFENNLEDMELFIVISKSGETRAVLDKLKTARENQIKTVAFTGDGDNRIGKLSDLWFQIEDSGKLDDRNMMANTFFPNVLLLFELLVYEYHRIVVNEKDE